MVECMARDIEGCMARHPKAEIARQRYVSMYGQGYAKVDDSLNGRDSKAAIWQVEWHR